MTSWRPLWLGVLFLPLLDCGEELSGSPDSGVDVGAVDQQVADLALPDRQTPDHPRPDLRPPDQRVPDNTCAAPSGTDLVLNGDETDVDCGGAPEVWGDCLDSDCDGVEFTVGNGSGVVAVTGGATLASKPTTLGASVVAGASAVTVNSASDFKASGVIMIHVAAGAAAAVGTWELAQIKSVSGTTLTLKSPLVNSYSTANTVNVARVPQYKDVNVGPSGELKTAAWNGSSGGVQAMLIKGTLKVMAGGRITVGGIGYRGGASSPKAKVVRQQGESHKGVGARTTSANLSGGGGGKAPSLAHACGGGGYATAGGKGGRFNGYSTVAGAGGGAAGSASLKTLLFGGAGGSGGLDADPGPTAYGGAGGSILLMAGKVSSAKGSLSAKGGKGGKGSEAGSAVTYGGAGGSGRIRVLTKSSSAIKASPAAYTKCP